MNPRTLCQAAYKGDLEEVNRLLDAGADPNEEDGQGRFPLYLAAGNGHATVIGRLLVAGALLIKKTKHGATPLHLAVEFRRQAAIEILIKKHVETNTSLNELNIFGNAALHDAGDVGDPKVIRMLIEAKAEFTQAGNKLGGTPLHLAVEQGHVEAVEEFVKSRMEIDLDMMDGNGDTPLHRAAWNGNEAITTTLLAAKANAAAVSKSRATPLHYAASCGHQGAVKLLIPAMLDLNVKNDRDRTPLHDAVWNGQAEVIEALLDAKPDLNAKDMNGNSPLHDAVTYGHQGAVNLLIAAKADLNATNNIGRTPLHEAVSNGQDVIIETLLDAKPDLNVKDIDGNSPLHDAVDRDYIWAVFKLLEAGANSDEKNIQQKTPLDIAIEKGFPFAAGCLFEKLHEKNPSDPIYEATRKVYNCASSLGPKASAEDKKALTESLNVAAKVVYVVTNANSSADDKTKAIQALNKNALTLAPGKPSTWKKFIGALLALVGVAVLIAGILLTAGASLAGVCVVGGLFALGGPAFFSQGMAQGFSKDLLHLSQVAASSAPKPS